MANEHDRPVMRVVRREERRRILARRMIATVPNERAQRGAQEVLAYIQQEARTVIPVSIPTDCDFYRVLRSRYLSDYLSSPSPTTGTEAIERIGRPFAGPAQSDDDWEEGALSIWNQQPVPEAFRRLRPGLPAEVESATDILSLRNWADLKIIDVPFLLGHYNTSRDMDAEVNIGGSNISQLMHWATGVKYSHIRMNDLRELFLGYELWHLEGWDGFMEDPINDLIAEESGRILGTQLREASIRESNLARSLNSAFERARVWVGSLLRLRRDELDRFLTSRTAKRCRFHWNPEKTFLAWNGQTIYGMLLRGTSLDDVKQSDLVNRFIGLYALIYEAVEWERSHNNRRISNTQLIESMARGDLNDVFERIARGQSVPSSRHRDVYSIAQER
uniref:Uncharacterized protein n=1 Tax=Candidatus Methanophagaceae archaeon ANME-1 ERB6 TaxID=2759912 RepID=A0A7G9YZH4_9EURY|nr:hypothetical protein JNHLJEBA_00018 [Methanosarcinales archaeon ANME-1 ERB6]